MAFQVEWIIKARDQFSEVAKNISKSMDGITKNIENFNKSIKHGPPLIKQLSLLGDAMTKNITLPLGAIAVASLNAARKYETLEAVFQGMIGSKQGADQYLSGLREMTDKLGIDFFDAAKGAQALYISGVKLKDVNPMVKTIGLLSAGTGTNFNEIADQIAEVNTIGVFTGRNLRTFANMHINVAQAIASYLKMPVDEVTKKLNKGAQISAKSLNIVLQSYTKSKQFQDQIRQQQQSLSGSFKILLNSLDGVNIGIGEQINKTLKLAEGMRWLATKIDKVNKNVVQSHPTLVKYGIVFGTIIAAIGPALVSLKWAARIFKLLYVLPIKSATSIIRASKAMRLFGIAARFAFSSPLGWIGAAIALLVVLLATTKQGRMELARLRNDMEKSMTEFGKFTQEAHKKGFFKTLGDRAWEATIGGIQQFKQGIGLGNPATKAIVGATPPTVSMRNSMLSHSPLKAPIPVSQIINQNPIGSSQASNSNVRVDINVNKAPGLTVDVKAIQQASKNVSFNVGKNLFGAGTA